MTVGSDSTRSGPSAWSRHRKVVQFSESRTTIAGHGVHTAFVEIVAAQRSLGVHVSDAPDRNAAVTHAHTVGPLALWHLWRSRGLRVSSAHVTPESLEGSLRGGRPLRSVFAVYLRLFYNRADLVVAVSPQVARRLQELGVRAPMRVVPHGIDPLPFTRSQPRTAARRHVGVPDERLLVLGVGQLQPRKAPEDFVAVARELPHLTFVWLGSVLFGSMSSARREMQLLAESAPPNVRFPGQVTRREVAAHCRAADVFLFPSRQETFGLAPLEAAMAGVPSVTRDLEVLEGTLGQVGETRLVGSGVPEFVHLVRQLSEDEELRTAMGSAARLHALRHAAIGSAAAMLDAYAGQRPSPGRRTPESSQRQP